MECMCAHTGSLGLYSHPKEFWGNGVRTHVNFKEKIPSTAKKKFLFRGGPNPRRCIKQDSQSNAPAPKQHTTSHILWIGTTCKLRAGPVLLALCTLTQRGCTPCLSQQQLGQSYALHHTRHCVAYSPAEGKSPTFRRKERLTSCCSLRVYA